MINLNTAERQRPDVATRTASAEVAAGAWSNDTYVKTADIKQAVQGHESAVLAAVGVDWTGSRHHINCPYPRHSSGGHSDWRWNPTKKVAHCTCIERIDGKKGHNIFDVVMAVEGLAFEAAKLRVAEIIGHRELIKTKNSGRGQKFDAASLLSPEAANRDDTLAPTYLGYRLGVDPAALPQPATRVIGLKKLDYYDPPEKEGGKPIRVGAWPCAVFELVDRNGRVHAHRIYLDENGRGKANLGIGPDGKPRDPKKLAPRSAGDSDTTLGLSVIWGNRETATGEIVLEGIETAEAAALACAAEIAAGEVVVAAAVSANGVEAFQPGPAAKWAIVAADRDEGVNPDGRPGSRRGEYAAREFCRRQLETGVQTGIALPGEPGEKVDWLDILLRDGVEAVRNGVLGATAFEPTAVELEKAAQDSKRDAVLKEITEIYPLPKTNSIPLSYRYGPTGKVMMYQHVRTRDRDEWLPITTPFCVSARLRRADQADAYGLVCMVQDMNGNPRTVEFERSALARTGAADIQARLFEAGLRAENDGDKALVQILKAADPEREIIEVSRPGWHDIDGNLTFVAPDGTVTGAPDGMLLELAASARMAPRVAHAGTFAGWEQAVSAATSVADCPHWTLGVIAGFVGPIVSLTGFDTFGVNFSGLSSSGKSTAQRLAVSVWSTADVRQKGLFQSARLTDNAVEAVAQRATATVLALDELAHLSGSALSKMIYTIAGGRGKGRMMVDASLRSNYTWSTYAVLSSETGLADKVRGDGGDWTAGMAVRIPDIDVDGVNRSVDAETLRQINAIEQHYGHAGPAFVTALVAHGVHRQARELHDRIDAAARNIAGGATADSASVRAATPFALLLVAAELARGFSLLPAATDVDGAVRWAWGRFQQSADAAVLDPVTLMIARVRQWVAERWDVTIKPIEGHDGVNNREAVAWYDDGAVYIPKDRLAEAAGNALKERQIGAALHKRGLLHRKPEKDRYTIGSIPKIGRVEAYALTRREFGRGSNSEGGLVYGSGRGIDLNYAQLQRQH